MTDWLIARLIGWLIDWLIDWLIVWWVGWLIDWLIDPLTDSFIHYLEPTWPSGKGIGLEIRRSRYVFKSLSDHWSLLLGRPWFNVSSVMLVNFIQNDANIFISFSRFLTKSHWSQRWQFHSLKLISHQLQFCPLEMFVIIKISQSAREKLDSHCKKITWWTVLPFMLSYNCG